MILEEEPCVCSKAERKRLNITAKEEINTRRRSPISGRRMIKVKNLENGGKG